MALFLSLESLGRRNVAGPLLLLNLALYPSMLGFASWALNTFVDAIAADQEYYTPADDGACMCMDTPAGSAPAPGHRTAGDEAATLHFIQLALLAAVLGTAAKAAAAFHARASWRPQGLAAVAALATVAWAVTALAFGVACKAAMRAAAARGWQMRALEALTATLAVTQLAYVLMLHRAAAASAVPDPDDEGADDAADAGGAYADAGDGEPGCSTATEGDNNDDDCQHQQLQLQQHGRHHHHHRQGQGQGQGGGGPSCGVM